MNDDDDDDDDDDNDDGNNGDKYGDVYRYNYNCIKNYF